MSVRVRFWSAGVLLALACFAPALRADPPPAPSPPPLKTATSEITRADRAQALHDEAAALYERGEYRIAVAKLEEALKLDPGGRELVYNLALIHERLGDIDDASGYYRRYLEMERDPRARDRVQATLKRLEGARKEVARGGTPTPPVGPRVLEAAPPLEPPPAPGRRYRGWVILLTSVAGTAVVASTGFGISAIAKNPGGSARTGAGVSVDDLEARASTAHRDAVVADVTFGIGALAGAAAVYLFVVGRPGRAPDPLTGLRPAPGGAVVSF